MNALQRRIQRDGWDQAAARYEQSWQNQLAPVHRALLARAAPRPGERVLDVACGTGLVTFAAAAAVGPAGPVMGVDLSGEMVTLARARARERGRHHVHFERMDAEDLTLPGGLFDMALCALGLMYMPDARKAVCEMARMLAPGGRAVAAVWGAHRRGWAEILPIVDARVNAGLCPLFFELGTGDRLASLFRRAGLTEVATETVDAQLEWRSADEACSAAFAAGPAAGAHSRFDFPTRRAAYREYLESIDEWRTGAGYAVPGEFMVVSGRKVG